MAEMFGFKRIQFGIIPLTRDGYHCDSSPYKHHHLFTQWVLHNKHYFDACMEVGDKLVGEWLLQTHSIQYNLNGCGFPFVVYDLFNGSIRLDYNGFQSFMAENLPNIHTAQALHIGGAISTENAMQLLAQKARFKSIEQPEGVVYRIEKKIGKTWKLLFLCKFVRADFEAGRYLSSITSSEPVYNMDLKEFETYLQ